MFGLSKEYLRLSVTLKSATVSHSNPSPCPVLSCRLLTENHTKNTKVTKPSSHMLRVDESYIEEFLPIRLPVRLSWRCNVWPATRQKAPTLQCHVQTLLSLHTTFRASSISHRFVSRSQRDAVSFPTSTTIHTFTDLLFSHTYGRQLYFHKSNKESSKHWL